MNLTTYLKAATQCVTKRLKPEGFTVSGNIAWRKVHDTLVIVHIQSDRHNSADKARFTVNLGVSIDQLRILSANAVGLTGKEVPPIEKCHWRIRLGRLLLQKSDVWWAVHDGMSAHNSCEEIATGLIATALPIVYRLASSEALIAEWQGGRGEGLTEYERLANLAKLLCLLNRIDETKNAIRALEEASIGTSWEVSARCDVNALRAQIT
jgi:Domain of unknown function (DUF4304)